MKILTFGRDYSAKKYPAATVKGFRAVKFDNMHAWYGGNVQRVYSNGVINIFVGEKGTIDAGVLFADVDKVEDVEDLRQLYLNYKHETSKKTWTKPLLVQALTGTLQ